MKSVFLQFTFHLLICSVLGNAITTPNGQQEGTNATVGEFVRKQIDAIDEATIDAATIKDLITIHKPPTSIVCNKTDPDAIKIVRNAEGLLYLLSVNELLTIEVNDRKEPHLEFLGTLLQFEEKPLEVQIEDWHNMTFVVLKLSSSLHVYVTKNDQRAMSLEPIQKINFHSSDRYILFKNKDDLYLVTYWIKQDVLDANELTFYKWKASFFSKESQELVDLPSKSEFFIFNENVNEPLILSIGYGNSTRVVILKLNLQTNRWTKLQSLNFKQDYVRHYVIKGHLYLIGCSTDSFCAIYEWKSSLFRRHIKVNNQIFEKIKRIYYQHGIIITEDHQRNLSMYTTDDIVSASPVLLIDNPQDVASYAIYKSPVDEKLFYVEFSLLKTTLAINFYDISMNKAHEIIAKSESKHGNGVECVNKLKSYLKNRLPAVQASQVLAQSMTGHDHTLQMDNKKFLRAKFSSLKDSKIRRVKIPHVVEVSASKLQKQAVNNNVRVQQTRMLLKRSKQSQTQGRAEGDLLEQMDNIVTEDLIYEGVDPIFQGLLLKSAPVLNFIENIKLRNLTSNKLVVRSNRINKIVLTDLLNTTMAKSIPGTKKLQRLKVKELITLQTLNDVPKNLLERPEADKPLELTEGFEFQGDINVKSLNVNALNGFNVSVIVENAFLQNERNVLRGNLFLRSLTNVSQLLADQLMEIPVENLMTTSSSQTIKANVMINKFYVGKLKTNLINNEKLSDIVATVDNVNVIEVPTQFMTIHVNKNLNLRDEGADESEQRNRVAETIETIKEHVIGKQTSDLTQIYNGRVVIQGSLVIKNMETFSPKTRIIVNGKEVPQNISNSFWMKNMKQEVFVEKFTINNQQVKAASAVTNLLNGHPVKKFMTLNGNNFPGTVHLTIENAIVEGDVKGHKDNFPSLLFHLNQTIVPRQGSTMLIDSSIDFRGTLVARNLVTNFINDQLVKDFVHNGQQQMIIVAGKNIKELELEHLHVDGRIVMDNYTNVNIKQFINDAVRIDRPIEFDTLKVQTFDAVNLITEFFEGHQFNEFIESLNKQFQVNVDGSTRAKRNVRISGNVEFQSDVLIDAINGARFDDLLNLFVFKNEVAHGIGGKKSFQQNVILTNLEAKLINQFPVDRLLYQSLARGERQTIAGEFFVKNLKTKSLRATTLNNITWNQFIDKTMLHLPLKINLNVHELITRNLESGSSSYDLNKMIEIVQYPKRKKWNTIAAYGANLPLLKSSYLDRIIQFGVFKSGPQQVITGQVQFNSNKVYMKSLIKPDGIVTAKLNPVNLHFLYSDSVKNETKTTQIIKGIKTFLTPIYVRDVKIGPSAHFDAKEINDVNIADLNQTMVRLTDVIVKEKKFLRLHVEDVEIRGKINGIAFDSLIFVLNDLVQLPKLNINQLELLDLKTFTFYDYAVSYFLQNRMRKFYGPDQEVSSLITFTSLNLLNDTILSSINQVAIDDIVFSKSDQLQEVLGHKSVVGNITLIGPSIIRNINDYDFKDFISNSVVRYKNHMKETMDVSSIDLKKGLVVKHSINGHRIAELLTSDAHIPKLSDLMSLMEQVQNQIKELNAVEKAKNIKAKRVLYIDYVPDIHISYDGARENIKRCSDKIIESAGHNNVIVRDKSDSEMMIDVPSATITVKPNLLCREGEVTSKELSLWWTYKDCTNQTFFRNFSFINEIADVKFSESRNDDVMMILTMLNEQTSTSEIAILWLNKNDNDWFERQPKLIGLNKVTKSAVVKTFEDQFLVVSTFNEATTPDSDYVLILRLELKTNMFVESQKKLVGDKFDVILSVDVLSKESKMKPRTFLLLTRKGSKTLFIYRIKESSQEFTFQRKIPFESEIIEVIVLYINNGPPYFIVSLQTGDFCVFEWRGIESWKVMQCGHFSFINQIKSYEFLKRQHLFLTSTLNSATALAIHRQGEQLL